MNQKLTTTKQILFVCVENSNRSQMAEAFARIHGAGKVEAHSAGSRPSGRVNAKAVEAMKEVGYDLSTHISKGLSDFNGAESMSPSQWAVGMNARLSLRSNGRIGRYRTPGRWHLKNFVECET